MLDMTIYRKPGLVISHRAGEAFSFAIMVRFMPPDLVSGPNDTYRRPVYTLLTKG
jgi:hypothetical protein